MPMNIVIFFQPKAILDPTLGTSIPIMPITRDAITGQLHFVRKWMINRLIDIVKIMERYPGPSLFFIGAD
jgi:hypothetical protein